MATVSERTRRKLRVNYEELNELSTADIIQQKKKNVKRFARDMNEVERVISARETKQGVEYLVKWKGWPMSSCNWEPAENLNGEAIRSYSHPTISSDRLERAAVIFSEAVLSLLKSKSVRLRFPETVHIDHDIIRFVLKNKGRASPNDKFTLYDKEDFSNFGLPQFWHYYLNALGQGVKVVFPIKIRLKLGFTSTRFVVNEGGVLDKAPLIPLEKVVIVINRRACSQICSNS